LQEGRKEGDPSAKIYLKLSKEDEKAIKWSEGAGEGAARALCNTPANYQTVLTRETEARGT
jgi:hypothetical protein